MPLQALILQQGPWVQGVDYSRPAEDLDGQTLFRTNNCRIGNAGQVEKRNGYTLYNTTALSGDPTLTGVGQHRFSSSSSATWCIGGAVFNEDVSGTWTDRTGGLTITAGDDNTFAQANAAGTLVLGNGVDAPIKWTAAAGNAAAFTWGDQTVNWTKWVAWFDNRLWFANCRVGGTTYVDRAYYTSNTDIQSVSTNDWHRTDEDIEAVVPFKNFLALHNENGIWALFPTHTASAPYQQQKQANRGAISGRSCLVHSGGTMVFVRRDGIYEWDGIAPPSKISRPLDGDRYWDDLNGDRLFQSHAVDYPKRNEVWFFLPNGTSQTTNNQAMIWNYRRRIWYGPYEWASGLVDFNCSALIDNSPHAGGYSDGLLTIHDSGSNDKSAANGAGAINAFFSTSAPPAINAAVQVRWLLARHHFDQGGAQSVTVEQISVGIPSRMDAFDQVTTGDAIETAFKVGTSRIATEGLMEREDTDLWGYDPSTQLRYRNPNADETFTIRRVELMYRPTGIVRKEVSGIE
jgi:hypothetical protein